MHIRCLKATKVAKEDSFAALVECLNAIIVNFKIGESNKEVSSESHLLMFWLSSYPAYFGHSSQIICYLSEALTQKRIEQVKRIRSWR